MESRKGKSGMLHQILPPRLEDAGLEDPSLPPDSIHQAFLKAAAAVSSGAASIFNHHHDNDDCGCVNDPWPTANDAADMFGGIHAVNEAPPGPCTVDRGLEAFTDAVRVIGGEGFRDGGVQDVLVQGEAKLGEEDVRPCVDDLRGLDIKVGKKGRNVGEEDDEKNKKPTLVEGFV
ncbi:hypothetical protein Fmac_012517 [Flemingia macrophylla]|uniref:Uncharacterized protein n=1 Tax=Flemingia macrophylla TaxID=520843 RepID=A0ABD1MQX5_9FABA